MVTAYLCETCGVQHAPRPDRPDEPPDRCAICEDERQYVGANGQRWTTLEALRAGGRRNELTEPEPGLTVIATRPSFAIGQRALLVRSPAGNLLWDCVGLIDEETIAAVRSRGGIAAIAVSHPHFYSAVVAWSRAFDGAPIWIHTADREWAMHPDGAIRFWEGDMADPMPGSGIALLRLGGHFPGAAAALWSAGAGGSGALLCGDIPQVVQDRRWVSFMYSYPNLIPLSAAEVRRIGATLGRHRFDRIYGGWADKVVESDAHGVIRRSVERYVARVSR
jgi:hypothetical protein